MNEISTKPYLMRAIHEWCVDNGFTPHLAVRVNDQTRVPAAFVNNGEIMLNVSPMATNKLQLGNEWIQFEARFAGVVHELWVPVEQVMAIYARENGQGMAFDVPKNSGVREASDVQAVSPVAAEAPLTPAVVGLRVVEAPVSADVDVGVVAEIEQNSEKNEEKPMQVRKNHLVRVK